ncbi:hypothetical protein [Roseobacter sp. EG26]|uniref:hypothetical protein n=1 Tax=Roseobacter sp. EG26 TaxID=3412477 RepID=UPI003CE561F4
MDAAPQALEFQSVAVNVEYFLRVKEDGFGEYKDFRAHTLGELPQVKSVTSHFCLDTSKDVRNRLPQ